MSETAVVPEAPPRRLIRLSKALEQLGFSRATFYRLLETDPTFPRPVRVRGGVRGAPLLFFADEISAYIEKLADAR
jgi:prophage regulatory protein